MNRLEPILGPLAIEECRRAVRRPWLVWGRLAGAAAASAATVGAVWLLWMAGQFGTSVGWGSTLLWGAAAIEMIWLVVALALAPALVAGSIASEKHQGTLALLLISRTSAAGVVGARFLGLYAQVALILLAGLPPLVLLAASASLGVGATALLTALPLCVALGASGATMFCSTLARQARDVLIIVYALEVGGFITIAWFASSSLLPADASELVGALNPFAAFSASAELGSAAPMLFSAAAWLLLGTAGVAGSIWQLWPAYRRHVDRSSTKRGRRERRTWTCPDERPMIWKEQRIDHGAAFGRIGRWLTTLLTLLVAASCLPTTMILGAATLGAGDWPTAWPIAHAVGDVGMYLSWLIQWLVGLRATATIAAERQRSTWDMLLTSPLDDREILWGKIWGSVYAVRWLVVATLASWTLALAAGAISVDWWTFLTTDLLAGGAFIVVVGLAVSVALPSSAKAMATTVGYWIAVQIGTAIGAAMSAVMVLLGGMVLMAVLSSYGFDATLRPIGNAGDVIFAIAFQVSRVAYIALSTYLAWLFLISGFDRRSGRAAIAMRPLAIPPRPPVSAEAESAVAVESAD